MARTTACLCSHSLILSQKNTRKLPGAAGQDAGTVEGDQGEGGGGDGDGVGGRKGRGKRKPPAIDFNAPVSFFPASNRMRMVQRDAEQDA